MESKPSCYVNPPVYLKPFMAWIQTSKTHYSK